MPQFIAEAVRPVSAGPDDETGALTAPLANGGHVVVWTDLATHATIYAQAYDAQGNAIGSPTQLFADAVQAAYGHVVGGIAALPDGSLVVTAGSYQPDPQGTSAPQWDIYQQAIDASGHALSQPTLVSSMSGEAPVGASYAGPVIAAADGGYYVENLITETPSPRSGYSATLQRFDAAGNAMGAAFNAGGGAAFPDVALLADGNIMSADTPLVVTYSPWINITTYSPNGDVVATSAVGTPQGFGANDSAPQLEGLTGGNAMIVWTHWDPAASAVVEAQLLDPAGNLVGSAHVLDVPTTASYELVALADGGALVWWADGDASLAQYLDANANPQGAAFSIGTGVSSVTATADGGFIVDSIHSDAGTGRDVFEQKFDAAAAGTLTLDGGTTVIGAGDFDIVGSSGIDTIAFAGVHTQYDVTATGISGPEGTDTLSGVERILFGDGVGVALDVHGNAGEAYRLYQAAFDRAPDLPGLGYHINDLDHGVPLWLVAQHFIDSPEFQSTYGATDNTQFITLLYQNVLHRAPDTGGLQFHLGEFAQGESRADMLIHFSESPENQANVIGQIDNGMLYVPLG